MSKHPTNKNQKKVQYIVKKGTTDFVNLEKIEKLFPSANRSDSIKKACEYVSNLASLSDSTNLEELNKKIKIKS